MRYTITSQQYDFFHREGWIEFEAFFSNNEADTLRSLLDTALEKHPSGRDLERENPPLLHALKLSRIGQVASALFHKKKIKLAFTQYPPSFPCSATLEEICTVTEPYGLALIHLEEGGITFYQKTFFLDYPALQPHFLMLVFASEKTRYKLQPKDPQTHFLKKLGYGFGDHLTDDTHPLLTK